MSKSPLESYMSELLTAAFCSEDDGNDRKNVPGRNCSYRSISSEESLLDFRIVADNAKMPTVALSESLSASASFGSWDSFDWQYEIDMFSDSHRRFEHSGEIPPPPLGSPATPRLRSFRSPRTAAGKWDEFRGDKSLDTQLRRPKRSSWQPTSCKEFASTMPFSVGPNHPRVTEKDLSLAQSKPVLLTQCTQQSTKTFPQQLLELPYDPDWNSNKSLHHNLRSHITGRQKFPLRRRSLSSLPMTPPQQVSRLKLECRPHSV
jgi:hypothetical protein